MKIFESEDVTQFSLRAPAKLMSRVRHNARANRRSLNAELVVMIEQSLPVENEKADAA
ncbi:Arc family DNA-binding protein [Devosia sp. 2618]|uniref:Arc family DNA-binding protein n=1 Tax=Devosia sp. 2618 TaxID=3156454 RepID=UPI0033931574